MEKKDEKYIEQINLFACLFQAAMWQSTTFSYDFHFGTKYSIKKFQGLAFNMLDKINHEIKNDDITAKYFDEQTSFCLDVVRETNSINDPDQQKLLLEIIKSFKSGNIKINREKDKFLQTA